RLRLVALNVKCGPLSLAFLDWYLALFANRFGALGKAHFQNTIVEGRLNLVLVHGVGKLHGSLEAAIAALCHAIVLLFLIALVLLFTAYRQDTVQKRKRDVLLVNPRKFSFDHDFLFGLRYVDVRGEGKASPSTGTEPSRESWQAANKAIEQAIHLRS